MKVGPSCDRSHYLVDTEKGKEETVKSEIVTAHASRLMPGGKKSTGAGEVIPVPWIEVLRLK